MTSRGINFNPNPFPARSLSDRDVFEDDEKVHWGLRLIGARSRSLTKASSEESPSARTVVLLMSYRCPFLETQLGPDRGLVLRNTT